jgi:molybdopterin molybdotransferase
MLTVEEALDAILSSVSRLGTERVDVVSSLGRVLAEPIVSRRVIPPWDNSSMDGYAVRAEDTTSGSVALSVVGRVAAGELAAVSLATGQAMRIFTGAPMPSGADSVVPQEDVETNDDRVHIRGPITKGAYVRPRGEDLQQGETVLEEGHGIGPAEVGMLATLGVSQVRVYRRPRVAVLSTGDEIADLGTEPSASQIPNTNTYSLMAQVIEAGGKPVALGVARDNLAVIAERVRAGRSADVLVSSAGVSVGEADYVKDALTQAGAQLKLWRVSMRPGKPITFGLLDGRPVFGLPGNPVSAMVTFELFVRPVLRAMAGHRRVHRARIRARALADIPNPGHRRGYLRVTLTPDGNGGYGARLTGEQGSAILRSMVLADGLAVVPGDTVVGSGDPVEVIVLRDLAG